MGPYFFGPVEHRLYNKVRCGVGVSEQFVIKSDEERIVLGVVYAPGSIDSDGEAMTEEAVKSMAYEFLSSGKVDKIDVQHNFEESGSLVVESFVARANDPDFTPGAWVMATKITDDDLWHSIKAGEINGYSFAGPVKKVPVIADVEITKTIKGTTQKSRIDIIPEHKHNYSVYFDNAGRIVHGEAHDGKGIGHKHPILAPDATELSLDHGHRINVNE